MISELKTEIKCRNLSESLKVDEVQLVLEPKLDEGGVMCCYYFVNPPTRSLFWLDEWEGDEIFQECKGTLSSPHKGKFRAVGLGECSRKVEHILGLAIQAQYWCATYVSHLL